MIVDHEHESTADCARAMFKYHERSKHRPSRYAPGPGYMDWANQPDPFRTFQGAERIPLPLLADTLKTSFNDVRHGVLPAPRPLDRGHIAILFELALGLSAWKSFGGTSWALRCNPSSGNLHPTEGYLVCPELHGLAGGVYHYFSRDHMLERRAAAGDCWAQCFPADGVIVGLTSIHWREAWKYGMRAYRYCQHDCGHALAAVAYAAAALGWRVNRLDEWGDEDIAALLGLDRKVDFALVEEESPDVLLWVGPWRDRPIIEPLVEAARNAKWQGRASRLSPERVNWEDIPTVDSAARKPRTPPEPEPVCTAIPDLPDCALRFDAARIIRQRRSAVDFDGVTSLSADSFFTLLDALLPRPAIPPWGGMPSQPRVHPMLCVHRVDGLDPGLYALVRNEAAAAPLKQAMRRDWLWQKTGPSHLPLYLLLPYDLREAAKLICCHQEIAADACFALGFLAQFRDVVANEPWRYRGLFWETGILGQVLYLEAEAAGIRATGIGCFFDDEMHELLGLGENSFQSLYHFTAGGAVEDRRLTTLPPYAHLRR